MADECFRVRQIPLNYTLDSLIQAVLEGFSDERDITIDRKRSSLVPCCYDPDPGTKQAAIIHFNPRPPARLETLPSGATYSLEISSQYLDILIDKHFYGLTQLYTPTKDIKLDIVAISGLNGHAYGSWAGEANSAGWKKMWLRHFFEKDRPECRTMIYGYNSRLSEPCVHKLSDYSRGLLEEIDKARKGYEDRPIALIGHSLGGIIIADAIVRDKENPRRGNLFKMTKTIVFFATPHRGLLFDDIVEMVGEGSPRLDLIHAIERGQDAEHLLSFARYAGEVHFGVVSFQETMETRKVEKNSVTGKWARTGEYYTAVERESSILNLPQPLEDVQSAEGNHSSLVKFDNQSNHAYTTLCERFRVLLNYIDQASGKDQAEINTKLRLAVLKNEHQLVSLLLTLGRANPNSEDYQCSIRGRALLPAISTKDMRMRRLLLRHGAKIDIGGAHSGYATLIQGQGEGDDPMQECDDPMQERDDPMQELRERPEEEIDLNHSKGRGIKHNVISNTSGIRRREILAWLSTLEPEDDHERIYGKRHENTGQWFLDSIEVQEWLEGLESTLLWCYGNPGVGKSVLTSTLLESINTKYEHEKAIGIAYFYFNFKITVGPQEVLGIWIKQLCRRMEELPNSLCALYRACIDNDVKPKRCKLEDLFQKVVNYFKQVFLVVDALDECGKESRNDLINYLGRVAGSCKIRIFIASRREVDIERNIMSARFLVLPIQVKKVDGDIAMYVDHELESRNQDYCAISKALKGAIRNRLMQQANGMFLWVKCQLDFIYEQPSVKDIQDALDCLPATMHGTYDRILKKINEQTETRRKLAHRALAWVITAKRPLTIRELVLVVALESTTKCCEELEWVYSQHAVLSSCCGLVTNDCGRVRLIHFTVQEFLDARDLEYLEGTSMRTFVTQSILVYLRSLGPCEMFGRREIHSTYVLGLELFQYACTFLGLHLREAVSPPSDCLLSLVRSLLEDDYDVLRWAIHATCGNPERAMPDDDDADDAYDADADPYDADDDPSMNRFYDDGDYNEYVWVSRRVKRVIYRDDSSRSRSLSPLGLLSSLGLLPLYLQLYPDVDVAGELNDVLNNVARGGSVSAMKELLDRGCDINYRGSDGSTPLITAASSGCEPVVLFLVASGADVRSLDRKGSSALYYACVNGMIDSAEILLEGGGVTDLHNALHASVRSGSVEMVDLLLEYDADISFIVDGQNALGNAVINNHAPVVQTLLDACADPNSVCGEVYDLFLRSSTVLQAAASLGRTEMVEMIIDAGADVNLQGKEYGTALQAAADRESEEIVEILLDAGADVNLQGGRYGTALQAAACRGTEEIVEILLDAGADVNPQGGEYGTALQAAAYGGTKEVVTILLGAGADVNLQGGLYGTALQAAAYGGTKEIVTILLGAGADVNLQGGEYGTALQAAAYGGTEEKVTILLDAGADVNLQGGKYGTALQAAAYGGTEEKVTILLNAGADVNLQGGEYGTALQAAVYRGNKEIVTILLDAGADVNLQGGEYGTALQAAAYRHNKEIGIILLKAGADVNLQGGSMVPLQAAARECDINAGAITTPTHSSTAKI